MSVTVVLDAEVAADVLNVLNVLDVWSRDPEGAEWAAYLGRAGEAVQPLRDVVTAEASVDAEDRMNERIRPGRV